jgi:type IV pilus assembly protein PilM
MFFRNNKTLAIDIGTSGIKLAELDVTSRGATLRKFGIFPLDPGIVHAGEIVEIGVVSQAIESLVGMSKTKRRQVSTGLWGNSVIIKKIVMPKMDVSLVGDQLKWEAEQYIPFDINEIGLEYHILKGTGATEAMDVLLVAAKNECMFRFYEAIETAKMKCAVVDIASFALANCFELNYGTFDRPIALINIGAGVTNFVILEKGEVTFARDISSGGAVYTTEISKSMNVSYAEAEALKISASLRQEVPDEVPVIIASLNEQVVDELKNSFEFYAATAGGNQVTKFYVCGGSMFIPGLVEQTSKVTNIPFEPLDPFSKISYDTRVFTREYIDQIRAICPVALGLGLRKLGDR